MLNFMFIKEFINIVKLNDFGVLIGEERILRKLFKNVFDNWFFGVVLV